MITQTLEQLQAEEVNKFNQLCNNNKGIEVTVTILPKSVPYRVSIKLQNPKTGNKMVVYQSRNTASLSLTTVHTTVSYTAALRTYTPVNSSELQAIFDAVIHKLATRERV